MVLVLAGFASQAHAQSACGGNVQYNTDLSSNRRGWAFYCCPDGYRVHGVAYADIHKQDYVDGVSVVCRSVSSGETMIASSDLQKNPFTLTCNKQEVMIGIHQNDILRNSGKQDDELDSLSPVCKNPKSGAVSTPFNVDRNNGSAGMELSAAVGKLVGIACKDVDKGGNDPKESDRADGCTIITK